tara:strand:+ start:2856 stop:3851 length:996 start_codon:yes stop_codon:yes gene_type:complete
MNNLINKEDTIFIAGSTGLVGSSLIKVLKKKGYNNLLTPKKNELNLLDFKSVEKWFQLNKPKIVILAAAKVGGIEANSKYPADFILENLKIQNNVIENAWRNNSKRFLFLGSSCIYPKFAEQPIKEEFLLGGELEKTNEPYAIAKITGIKLCNALKRQYGFDAISLMPTNLYGPGDNYNEKNSHVMPALIRRIYDAKIKNKPSLICWGSGLPKREFLYVDDLSDAAIFTLENVPHDSSLINGKNKNSDGIINVGNGSDISILDLTKIITKKINYKGKIIWDKSKPDGTPRKLLNIDKLNKLGWFPKINLNNGIDLTIKSFKEELEKNSIRI